MVCGPKTRTTDGRPFSYEAEIYRKLRCKCTVAAGGNRETKVEFVIEPVG